jgi:5-formyltetrahydrofolate cyclo-ligase
LEEEAVTAAIQDAPEWRRAGSVLLYRSVAPEFSTVGLANGAWRLGKRVLFPRVAGDGLGLHEVRGWQELRPGAFGIPEPIAACPEVLPVEAELAIIPALAWDRAGRRLGRGGGHYDRLLPRLEGLRWGVGFDVQLVEEVPVEGHDQSVQRVWTCAAQNLLPP